MILEIKRALTVVASVEIDQKTIFVKKLMGEHKIKSEFYVQAPLGLQLGDYIEHNSQRYSINRLPEIEKVNNITYKYSVEFEGEEYTLYNKLFMWQGDADFSYPGAPSVFISLIVGQINTIDSGWSVGAVDSSEEKTLTFNNVKCRAALTQIAGAFGMEYDISGKSISLKKAIGTTTPNRFEYGRGKGLYKLTRLQISDQNIVTRIYGFGGTKNLPVNYGTKKLTFGSNPLSKNTDLYGVIEGIYNNEEIYPHRTGTVGSASITFAAPDADPPILKDEFYVQDLSIDFDLNANLIEGKVAKIVFKSGDLSGYEFEIYKFDNENKRIYFNPFIEDNGYVLPNTGNTPKSGDQYTLIDIEMPQAYIDAAELELKNKTQEYLDQNCIPQVTYALDIDRRYVKSNSIALKVGDKVTVFDAALGIDSFIRVSDIQYPLVDPNSIRATISDSVLYTTQEKVIQKTVKNAETITQARKEGYELARQNTAAFKVFKDYLLDPDGEFDQELISAKYIKALLAEFGTVAGNFILDPIPTFLANYNNNVNSFQAPAADLVHLELSIEIEGSEGIEESYIWSIANAVTFSGLTTNEGYWLYAKCSKSQATGVWELSQAVIPSNGETDYYFPAGVLLPVDPNTGVRVFIPTFGKTYINGREITTGRVQSIDGLNYLDLDYNQFKIGNAENSLDWNVTKPDTLTIKGAIVQSPSGDEYPVGVFRGAYNLSVPYFKGDQVTYEGSTWLFVGDIPATGQAPAEGQYWTEIAAKGVDGADGADGSVGSDARVVNLTTDKQGFSYNVDGLNPSPATATVTATALNTEGTVYYEFFKNDVSVQNTTSNTYTYTPDADYSNMPDKIEVQIREGSNSGTILARDQITLVGLKPGSDGTPGEDGTDGLDGLTVVLSNEAHALPVNSAGSVNYSGSGTTITVWEGTQKLNYDDTYPYSAQSFYVEVESSSNISPGGISDGGGKCSAGNHSNMSADTASITYRVTVKRANTNIAVIYKTQTFAKSHSGADGNDGSFIEYRYAKNGSTSSAPAISVTQLNPSGWSTVPPTIGTLEYLWITKAKKSFDGSTLLENWSAPVRISGVGSPGPAGPSPVYQGVYSASKTYYGNSTRVDIVKYGSSYYVARADAGTFSGTTPTSTSKWNSFGAQFESVATDLLFASLAYIDNLGVKYLRTGTSGQRVFINGDDGSMRFYDSNNNEIMTLANGVLTAAKANIKSASSGKRVEIDASTNNLKFFDSSGNLKITFGELLGAYYYIKAGTALFGEDGVSIDSVGGPIAAALLRNGLFGMACQFSPVASVDTPYTIFVRNTDGRLCYRDGSNNVHAFAYT